MKGLMINGELVANSIIEAEWDKIHTRARARIGVLTKQEERILKETTLQRAKDQLIDRLLLEKLASEEISEIPYAEILLAYEEMIAHFGDQEGFASHFADIFAKDGSLDLAKEEFRLKENIEKSLKVDALLRRWEDELPTLALGDIERFYHKHRRRYAARTRVIVSIIEGVVAQVDGAEGRLEGEVEGELTALIQLVNDLQREETDAEEIITALFKEVTQYDLRIRERVICEQGSLSDEVEDYLFDMKDQTLSGLVRTKDTIHLFWKWETLPAGFWELEHISEQVQQEAQTDQKNKHVRKTLQTLRAEAHIEDTFVGLFS